MFKVRGKRLDLVFIFAGYIMSMSLQILIWYMLYILSISKDKKIIVASNIYGEHYMDIACMLMTSLVSIIGLYYLLKLIKKESK